MEIIRYSVEKKIEWDKAVKESKNGIFQFLRDYMDYHNDRFRDHSLLIYKKSKIIAIFPANEVDEQIVSHGGLTFGSLIMSYEIKAVEVLEAVSRITEYYKSNGFVKITYKIAPHIFHKYPSGEELYALHLAGAKLIRRDLSSVIKIKEKIRFSESKRQAVTKCIKNDIIVVETDDFSEYWDLLTSVLHKFNTSPVHSFAEIDRLRSAFPSGIRLFEARQNDIILGGVVIYDYGKTVHTQYMANSDKGRKWGALDYINHYLITEVFPDREYFSFGISTEQQGMYLNEGLVQQKEMMGARAITLDFYSLEINRTE